MIYVIILVFFLSTLFSHLYSFFKFLFILNWVKIYVILLLLKIYVNFLLLKILFFIIKDLISIFYYLRFMSTFIIKNLS